MSEEKIQEKMNEQKYISEMCGMLNYEHYEEFKENAINGLMLFGDKFQEALGMALDEATDRDAVKIIRNWKNECSIHEMLYRMHVAKQNVLEPTKIPSCKHGQVDYCSICGHLNYKNISL